jgi:hypothetical protein
MSGRSRYLFGTFRVCSEAGGDVVAVHRDVDFRNLEYREDREDCSFVVLMTACFSFL